MNESKCNTYYSIMLYYDYTFKNLMYIFHIGTPEYGYIQKDATFVLLEYFVIVDFWYTYILFITYL